MLFYPPSEDSYLMEDAIKEKKERNIRIIVEVGSGSGYVSKILQEEYPLSQIISTDINPHATEATARLCAGITTTAVRTSMIDGLRIKADLALFNPPYLPSEEKYLVGEWMDRAWAGGVDGMEVTNKFLDETADIRIRYVLLCQYNNPESVIKELKKNKYAVTTIKQQKILNEHLQIIRIEKMPNV
ncbi:release factor glutamine methyltransferase [Nematocida parisii]|nr:release factor glutamine methyltransferase [Nematocida parisii]